MKSNSNTVVGVVTALFVLTHFLPASNAGEGGQPRQVLSSPDGSILLTFEIDGGVPSYSATLDGEPVLLRSMLGFELKTGSLGSGFSVMDATETAKDETWEQVWGEHREVRNHHRELALTLHQTNGLERTMCIVFRVFDHAIAFRYEWPEQPTLHQFEIMDELTEFVLPDDHMALWQPALRPEHAEQLYAHTRLSEILRQTRLKQGDALLGVNPEMAPLRAVTTPLTLQSDGGRFLVIHEANLTDFAAMHLEPTGNHGLKSHLVPWSDGVRVRAGTPFVSPWRLVMVSDQLSDIVELTSLTARNLNPPCRIPDTSWIEPGKYAGIWWGMHLGKYTWDPTKPGEHSTDGLGATTPHTRDYIDFASAHGLTAVLVEGWNKGWARDWVAHADGFSFTEPNEEYDLEELAVYARSKGVGLIAHHETGAIVENYERQAMDAFAQCQRLGIHHVKSGYVGMEPRVVRQDADGNVVGREYLDGQYMVRHYRKIVELAAKHQVMMDVHESIKDTGESRTWPNMMTRESARGQEFNAWAGDGGNPPGHDVNLAFTRCLSGPFDFTPGVLQVTFPEYQEKNRVNTTVAKQLALYVTFYSPLQMAADLPEHYARYPDLLQFIEDVPTDWEETRLLDGEIGEYIIVARKERGVDEWYIGAITDEKERLIKVPLTFLSGTNRYTATAYRDADDAHWETNPYGWEIDEQLVGRGAGLTLRLAPGGGQALRLKPATREEIAALQKPE